MKELRIYVDFVEDIEDLGEAEVGRLFRSMLRYAADDSYDADDLKGNERFLWKAARKTIKRQWAEYREMCERNKRIATSRYESSKVVVENDESCQEKTNKIKEKKIKENINIDFTPPFDGKLREAVDDWIAYKKEKRQNYKPTGLKTLFTQIQNNADQYGEDAVIKVIRDSMSSNYAGIMFDRIKKQSVNKPSMKYSGRDDTELLAQLLKEC